MSLLECKNVSFAYDSNVVLTRLNFQIESGNYLCVVGENGSGKSTLIRGILRLKAPTTGELIMADGFLQNEIGYLPQQTAAQKDFPASVYEVVLSGRQNSRGIHPFYCKNDKREVIEKMEMMGIEKLKNQCYRELSGGQQQRVLLARALCASKKMLLLDEPVSGLDPVVTQEMYRLIQDINDNFHMTIIMVSHDIQSAVKYASHILHLGNKQLFFGSKEQYINSTIGKRFLEVQ